MNEFGYRGSDGLQLYAAAVGGAGERAGTSGPVLVLLHGGGPDHRSLLPLAERLADLCRVVLPDIRGYGASICTDPSRHTWAQYAEDVVALLNHLSMPGAIVGGAGLGATIALRAALAYPERILGSVLISVEDIEADEQKQAEIAFMDAFAVRVRTQGIEAAWAPILGDLAPVVGAMVREAIPRSDSASIAAAASIGRDRAFHGVDELVGITSPTLIFRGMDWRHPPALAEHLARLLPKGRLAPVTLSADVRTAHDFAGACAPAIREFITDVIGPPRQG
ncbi:alpha/beta hydrolase [Longimicrobium sp.]|uniref:alpha/beta fold hydrolase n=1 Tax=Longimicrobium sp. TaxID=2029185 RepID=UPI002E3370BE|nr:alpha/beta hydrolase [Longimicrobium sp.]HEX6042600.1 alpha/beta hydrolase [Longimicrobium sp.]